MRIHAIQTGEVQIKTRHLRPRFGPRPLRLADVLADRAWTPRLPIACFAIEHPEGLVLVDTGESSRVSDPGYEPRWHPFARFCTRFWVAPEQEAGARLRALGLEPERTRWVVMTHMHGDHAGGLGAFARSEVVMSDREARRAFARTGPVNGYHNANYPAWLAPRRVTFERDPWESFEASVPLTSDGSIRLVPTPGHTSGHLSVVVEDGERLVVLAGDAAYSERALLDGRVDGVAEDARTHRDSSERLRELCRRRPVVFLPTHDPESPSRLAESRVTQP